MRVLALLALLSYWLTHPGAVQHLVRLATVGVSALAHAGGDHAMVQGTILLLGSHWH